MRRRVSTASSPAVGSIAPVSQATVASARSGEDGSLAGSLSALGGSPGEEPLGEVRTAAAKAS